MRTTFAQGTAVDKKIVLGGMAFFGLGLRMALLCLPTEYLGKTFVVLIS